MTNEKPYCVTNIKIGKKFEANELEIWLQLRNNTIKTTVAVAGVTLIDKNGFPSRLLEFLGGTHRMIKLIGASDRHQEYCFPIQLNDDTMAKLLLSPTIGFNVEIDNNTYKELLVVKDLLCDRRII